jgi:hypothetical protein
MMQPGQPWLQETEKNVATKNVLLLHEKYACIFHDVQNHQTSLYLGVTRQMG